MLKSLLIKLSLKEKLIFSCPRDCLFDLAFISYNGALSMLLNLNITSSCGPDGISNAFLHSHSELLRFLVTTFRCSLSTGSHLND